MTAGEVGGGPALGSEGRAGNENSPGEVLLAFYTLWGPGRAVTKSSAVVGGGRLCVSAEARNPRET